MLFMVIFQWEPGMTDEVLQKRRAEETTEGRRVIHEWMAIESNMVFRLMDITDPVVFLKHHYETWGDLGYTEMHPVLEAKEALKHLR